MDCTGMSVPPPTPLHRCCRCTTPQRCLDAMKGTAQPRTPLPIQDLGSVSQTRPAVKTVGSKLALRAVTVRF
jgi:hypothetical protein